MDLGTVVPDDSLTIDEGAVRPWQALMWSQETCPDCHGSRLTARWPKLRRITLDEACQMTLSELTNRVAAVPDSLPEEMRPMAYSICESFRMTAKRLMDLGLGYLTLDWASSTFSTGERQRMQLARAVRSRTTGVLYVLDEPSIGLHSANIVGLPGVMNDLVADGKSAILVDHDTQILESLMPGLEAAIQGKILPKHILHIEAESIQQVKLIDATPIGINVRSAVATYANVHDELRKLFARTPDAKAHGYKTGDFSYNTGSLRCPTCDGTGVINLDVQFLPDVGIPCPDGGGSRYSQEIVL